MNLQTILDVVNTTTNQRKESIIGKSRKPEIVTARFLFFYFSRKYTEETSITIPHFVNRKNKVYFHALNKVDCWRKVDRNFRAIYETININ